MWCTASSPDRRGPDRIGEKCAFRGACGTPESGYLTVYMSLTVAVLLPLLLILIHFSAAGTSRLRTACGAQIASDSVLAEFHRELQERYDLFYVDTAYAGDSTPGTASVAAHLCFYLEKNLEGTGGTHFYTLRTGEVRITGTRAASDDGGRSLREQVYAYMSADPAGSWAAAALVTVDRWHGLELDTERWMRQREENAETLREQLDKGEKAREEQEEAAEGSDSGTPETPEESETLPQRLLSAAEEFMQQPILRQVYGAAGIPSGGSLEVAGLPSHRVLQRGTGAVQTNSHAYPQADELLFDEYILEKCGDLLHEARSESPLRCQVEYILGGRGTDRANLEVVAERLMLLRGGLNCTCLFGDEGRKARAGAVAAAVSLVLFNPELKEPLKTALLFGWAYLETVVDVRTLMKGGRVPLVKTPENWQTSLTDLLTPEGRSRTGTYTEGFDYRDHLRGLLYLEGGSLKTRRLMDVIEMEIRQTPHGDSFRIDQCIDILSFQTEVKSSTGETWEVEMTVGYD